jgi:GTPase SAR1 family protein
MQSPPPPSYKIALIGPPGAGKSSLLWCAQHGSTGAPMPTIGCDFGCVDVDTSTGECIRLLRDTSGRIEFEPFMHTFTRGVCLFLLVVDPSRHARRVLLAADCREHSGDHSG